MSRTFTLLGYLVFSCSLATAQFVNGVSTTGPAPWIDITAYGAKADSVQPTTTCSLSTVPPGKNLTCTGVSFLPTDVGKVISVYGGAVGGADLFTTIISLVGAAPTTTVVLFVAGVSGASNLTIRYSTDNTFPIQSAINAAKATGSTIYFPYAGTGNYYLFGNPTGTPAVGLTITPVAGQANPSGLKLIGECGEPNDPGTQTSPSNCSMIVTDQPILMLSVGDPAGNSPYHGFYMQDLGFRDVSTSATTVVGGIAVYAADGFNFTNVRVQRIENSTMFKGYGILFDGTTGASANTQFGVLINPSIYNTKTPILTNHATSEINLYGGNLSCVDAIGGAEIAGSTGMDLGASNMTSSGEWGVFGTHILDCATGLSMFNSSVMQWHGVAEQTLLSDRQQGTGVLVSGNTLAGGNFIGGSINNFATGVNVGGTASDTIVAGSITNNNVGVELSGSETGTKIIGTISSTNGIVANNTSLAVTSTSLLPSTLLLTNQNTISTVSPPVGQTAVLVGSQIPTGLTLSTAEATPATNPASGRRIYLNSGSNSDLSLLRPDGTINNLESLNCSQTTVQAGDTITAAGAFATKCTIPAGFLTVNSVIDIWAAGVYSTTGTASPVAGFSVTIGATTALPAASAQAVPLNQTNDGWNLLGRIICISTGAPGTGEGDGEYAVFSTSAGNLRNMTNAATFNLTTSTSQTLAINEAATLVAGQSFTMRQLIVRITK